MDKPLEPWWTADLLMHPLAASHMVVPQELWAPTPAPAPRIEAGARTVRVAWQLDDLGANGMDVEVVGDLLVLRVVSDDGQLISRAISLPEDVDLSRRRDTWRNGSLEVVVPRIQPSSLGRVRLWIARLLRQVAASIAPQD